MIETELLAPAGNWDCARAAVANGADAIFFGLPKFNARMRADNFTEEDLPELMSFLHRHGVKGFVAMNTLVFESELEGAAAQVEVMGRAGVDAVIVQDLGLASLLKKIAPEMEVHASTQMTISSPEGLNFVNGVLGLERAVLARELSVEEIGRVGKNSEVPLEVFVHGALCVAYSGQCLTSESLGQRSANRGECAQACRMPYELVVDGKDVPLGEMGEVRYLLSPQDLAAVDLIPDLVKAGVKSYKIEGRLKSPEYVAAVTSAYRKALDNALDKERKTISPEDKYMLEMTFSRGLSTGWLAGTNHPYLTHGKWGKKRGVYVGTILESGAGFIEIESEVPLAAGEGFVFDAGEDRNQEQGGIVWQVKEIGENRLRLIFDKRAKIDWGKVSVGQDLYKTSDPKLESAVRKMWKGVRLEEKGENLNVQVSGGVGEKLVVTCRGKRVESEEVLEKAEKRALTADVFEGQFSRLGGTGFQLGEVDFQVVGEVMVRVSELNRMRRAMVDLIGDKERLVNDGGLILSQSRESRTESRDCSGENIQMRVLCRSLAQVRGALAAGCDFVYADFEDLREYKEAVALARVEEGTQIYLATPRIQKPGEVGFFKLVERAEPDGVLVRNLGAVSYFKEAGMKRVADFSLNVSNSVTADLLLKEGGFENLTVSYDLNGGQVGDLLKGADPNWFELTLHQHMPMFHMEHCVFCTFLSEGTSIKDCGKPCDRHEVKLRDRVGQLHTLKADVGCRNTLFNGRAQTGAESWEGFYDLGMRRFRLELLEESEEEVMRVVGLYRELFSRRKSPKALTMELGVIAKLGVTEGTMQARRSEVHS